MNMKKIIASALTAVMALSTVASAATSSADLADVNPTWTLSEPVQLTTKSEVQALTNFTFAKSFDDATYDYYKVTYKVTDLGPLKNEYAEDIIGIYNITLEMDTAKIVNGGVKAAAIANTTSAIGKNTADNTGDWYALTFTADGGIANPYPKMDEDTGEQAQEADGTVSIDVVLVVDEGSSFTVDTFRALVVYITDAGKYEYNGTNLPTSFTIGKTVEEDKPVVFTAPLVEKTANGYIWALNFTQSASKLASLKADFATADDSAERAFQNVAAFVATLGGADAGVTLNVGLKTTKTLTAATFTADDAVETTEACVFEAPLSK